MYFFVLDFACYLLSCSTYSQVELFYQKDEQVSLAHTRVYARVVVESFSLLSFPLLSFLYLFLFLLVLFFFFFSFFFLCIAPCIALALRLHCICIAFALGWLLYH